MKKSLIIIAVAVVSAIAMFPVLSPAGSGNKNMNLTIGMSLPDSVSEIVNQSCIACHSANGNPMARGKLNFDIWDSYSVAKQYKKASSICKKVTKGSMPPGTFVASHPEAAMTAQKIAILCGWAKSLPKK